MRKARSDYAAFEAFEDAFARESRQNTLFASDVCQNALFASELRQNALLIARFEPLFVHFEPIGSERLVQRDLFNSTCSYKGCVHISSLNLSFFPLQLSN